MTVGCYGYNQGWEDRTKPLAGIEIMRRSRASSQKPRTLSETFVRQGYATETGSLLNYYEIIMKLLK